MAEHTAVVAVTYRILGEAEEFTGTFVVNANRDMTGGDLARQVQAGADHIMETTVLPFGKALTRHLEEHTRD